MNTERAKRKLSAILSADVKGYSRLMGEDEIGTVRTLKEYRELMSRLVKEYRGRVVDSPGDNVLAEFASVVDALECSIEIQKKLKTKNAALADNRKMEFRIGVNLGDVIEDEERVYGDGVNIAARIEGLAEPGGICISGSGFEQVRNKLPLGYEYLGEHTVKNIVQPIKMYRVLMEPDQAGKVIGEKEPKRTQWRWAAAVALLVLVAGGLAWHFYWQAPKIEPASKEKMAFPLPDKPSIAVLPFVNISGDPSQEYIAEGICESIITALCKIPEMFVIARTSTSTYKGKSVTVKKVSEELGVRYVLEGSVQKTGDRIRVTAQLIDATTGHHLWADRYDRDTKGFFDVLDEISKHVTIELQVKLTEGDAARMSQKTKNFEAWGYATMAYSLFRLPTKVNIAKSRELFEKAVEIDPNYAFAWGGLAATYYSDVYLGYTESREKSFALAVESVDKSLKLDETLPCATGVKARLYMLQKQFEQAIALGEKAVALAPSQDLTHFVLGFIMGYAGRLEEAIAQIKAAMRLNPICPSYYLTVIANAYFLAERYEEALEAHKKALEHYPKGGAPFVIHLGLSASCIEVGREAEARTHAAEVIKINPKVSLESLRKGYYSYYQNPAHSGKFISALRKAGLPETPPLPLPDKPSIAVLPFVNMSDDKGQEYFSDGLTEEIITALSKTPKLFVIARNSTFVYKGKPVNVQQVSRELGVKYVLEGSVRRSGDQLRITAQLIDATSGNHLWAERYDRELKDIFEIQDNITLEIMKALDVKLIRGVKRERTTDNLEAFFKLLQANDYIFQFNRESNVQARKLTEDAIKLDPQFASAYYGIAAITMMDVMLAISKSPKESRMKAIELCQKATSLDDTLAGAYGLLGYLYVQIGEYEEGVKAGERAIEVGPSSAEAHSLFAQVLNFSGRAQEAIALNEKAFRLNPVGPTTYYYTHASFSYVLTGRYEDAVRITRRELSRTPNNVLAYARLVWALSASGRDEEAIAAAQNLLRIDPKFSARRLTSSLNFKDPSVAPSYLEHMLKAGLSE